jgi:NAD(P)H-hydrate epimerase
MATAGMGDVLTGVTAGLLAQFPQDPRGIAATAAYVHAAAGDDAAEGGARGLLAGDLLGHLRKWINPVSP